MHFSNPRKSPGISPSDSLQPPDILMEKGVFCRFREEDMMSRYFPESEFTWSRVESGTYRFRLSDVGVLTGHIEKRARMDNCIPLKDTDHALQNSLLNTAEKNETLLPLPHPLNWEAYDGEISALYRDKDVAEGAILVDKVGDELVILKQKKRKKKKNEMKNVLLLKGLKPRLSYRTRKK